MCADLDKAIDGAVREMLDVEPPADLRARVIAQLPAAGSRLSVFGVRWFAALAAVAALLVLVVTLARRSGPPAQPPVVAHDGQQLPPDARPIAPIEAPSASRRIASTSKNAVRPAVLVSAASTDATVAASAIDPLESITPIEVAQIAQRSITPEPIDVRPLNSIPEMQVAPLNPPDRRD